MTWRWTLQICNTLRGISSIMVKIGWRFYSFFGTTITLPDASTVCNFSEVILVTRWSRGKQLGYMPNLNFHVHICTLDSKLCSICKRLLWRVRLCIWFYSKDKVIPNIVCKKMQQENCRGRAGWSQRVTTCNNLSAVFFQKLYLCDH